MVQQLDVLSEEAAQLVKVYCSKVDDIYGLIVTDDRPHVF